MADMAEHIGPLFEDLNISGDICIDDIYKTAYSTDASPYRERPLAVVYPRDENDLCLCVKWADKYSIPLIPRGGGTSLAGQVVGNGVIVDVSKYMTNILEVNAQEHWVRVQPGVIRDVLNDKLKNDNLFFAPETSTTNRCTLGGMVGNNSCGLHSLVYGSTRDHVLELKVVLSDGSVVWFKPSSKAEFLKKIEQTNLEGKIYARIYDILSDSNNRQLIRDNYPYHEIRRRNNGYALDEIMDSEVFGGEGAINLCKLLAGSEGTFGFISEIKLNLSPLPPSSKALICVHLNSVEEALHANLIALRYSPMAVELMDKAILDRTANNVAQRENRFFLKGDPGALLIVEFSENTFEDINAKFVSMEIDMRNNGYGYHFAVVKGNDISKVWALRKSGLGVLTNTDEDAKPVSEMEDTAVRPQDLPAYIKDIKSILSKYNLECVYHAHIATGELHLRPILNLKDPAHVEIFKQLAQDVASIVKRYRGSLSGEHGDGRLRGEFIPYIYGDKIYSMFLSLKQSFDPKGILNPGKITKTPPMNTSLRYVPGRKEPNIKTFMDFSKRGGILRAVEKCNGSGDCRRVNALGGVMCPSYLATGLELNSTRARANVLREYLTNYAHDSNPFDHKEIYQVMDNCLLCKGCKKECPSNVDMAKLKIEFLYQWYRKHGVPFRSWLVANINTFNKIGSLFPTLYNFVSNLDLFKRIIGFSTNIKVPQIAKKSLRHWIKHNLHKYNSLLSNPKGSIILFVDEFTDMQDTNVGISAIQLFFKLGYRVETINHSESGRASISKGLLKKARKLADTNVLKLKDLISDQKSLVGLEPSCILSFRDEYPDIVSPHLRNCAKSMSKFVYTFEEFLCREIDRGNVSSDDFVDTQLNVIFHGHCQQKAIVSTKPLSTILQLPSGCTVKEIPSGCCGMAGSFGYEKEHHDLSVKIGNMVLFPEIRKATQNTIIVAPGTSCRHHIKGNTNRIALHPAEFLLKIVK